MKKMFFLLLIGILINPINNMYSQSIKFGWTVPNAGSKVLSMKFMPDQDYFICATESNGLQIRKTEDGSLFKSYPQINGINDIEFTSDSTKIILAGASLQIRNLSDMSIVSIDSSFKTDNLDQYYYEEIEVHPTKPIIFVKFSHYRTNKGKISTNIFIYDLQNLKKSIELTDASDMLLLWKNLRVSNDGKYLALATFEENVSNQAYLKIWNCETLKPINKFLISDSLKGYTSSTSCLQFSKNSDVIYLSGSYPKNNPLGKSMRLYSILQNNILDTYIVHVNEFFYGSNFTLFDNENRLMLQFNDLHGNIQVLNLSTRHIEYASNNTKGVTFRNNIINKRNNFNFLGSDDNTIVSIDYDTLATGITQEPKIISNLYPNPTNGYVNINLNCMNQIHYEIYNLNGIQVFASPILNGIQNSLNINFVQYPVGTYTLRVYCGNNSSLYRVVKI